MTQLHRLVLWRASLASFGLAMMVFSYACQAEPVFVNGGVGQEEAIGIRSKANLYNLQMYFYEGNNSHSTTGVKLCIRDIANDAEVLNIADAGPMTFIQLNLGKYEIVAELEGVRLSRRITVTKAPKSLFFNWDLSKDDEY